MSTEENEHVVALQLQVTSFTFGIWSIEGSPFHIFQLLYELLER